MIACNKPKRKSPQQFAVGFCKTCAIEEIFQLAIFGLFNLKYLVLHLPRRSLKHELFSLTLTHECFTEW